MARKSHHFNWTWAENFDGNITEENCRAAYSLNSKLHKPFSCRKNCRLNPLCLSGFGESSWKDPIDPDSQKSDTQRVLGSYVGLKNLGNTCYISSLLQLWFHSLPLREAVYLWNALEDNYERQKHLELFGKEPDTDNYKPQSSVAHLQVLFAEMEFGKQNYCDPEAFCRSLSIDVELQQDAQEFSKLYMARLEETFASAANEKTRTVIQSQFRGEYSYVTTCSKCKTESRRDSYFYELELSVKGLKTIQDSMNEFIRDEKLAGDNKYLCSVCNNKEDAITGIKLKALPPFLQLQLIRYCFDMATATKKKITQPIEFPDVLDMSPYLGLPNNSSVYSLQAVLMHGGTSANSGHYYSHIKTVKGWHVFDDTTVKKQKQLSLMNDTPTPPGEKKLPKVKGSRSSSSAYMLVYKKMDVGTVLPQIIAKGETSWEVKLDNDVDSLPQSSTEERKCDRTDNSTLDEQMENCIDLKSEESEKLEDQCKNSVAMTDTLKRLSVSEIAEDQVENLKYAPKKITKREGNIEGTALNQGMNGGSDFAGSPEDEGDGGGTGGGGDFSPFTEATDEKKHWELLPDYIKNHITRLNNDLASLVESELVDIQSKNLHQQFITDFLDDICPQIPPSDLNQCDFMNYEALLNLAKSCEKIPLNNSPLLCQHGNLNFEAVKDYKLVSKEAADKYINTFGGGPRITGSQLCKECVFKRAEIVHHRSILMTDKKTIADLLRPPILENQPSFWVGKRSIRSWWQPIEKGLEEQESQSSSEEGKPDIDIVTDLTLNADITCPHGGLTINEDDRRLVSSAAWDLMTKYYPSRKQFPRNTPLCLECKDDHDLGKITERELRDKAQQEKQLLNGLFSETRDSMNTEIFYLISAGFVSAWRRYTRSAALTVLKERPSSDLIFDSVFCVPHSLLIYNPNFDCDRFFMLHPSEWETLQLLYNVDHELFASRKEDGTIKTSIDLCSECIAERISTDEFKSLEDSYHRARIDVYKVSNEVDEETVAAVPNMETKKLTTARKRKNEVVSPVPPAKKPATEVVRRSARSRQPKGDRESFIVDKSTTLKDFKVMICQRMSVLPCDQHLFKENGEDLDELQASQSLSPSEATLLRLGVPPNSLLRLVADEPKSVDDFLMEPTKNEPETGFKGTELGGR